MRAWTCLPLLPVLAMLAACMRSETPVETTPEQPRPATSTPAMPPPAESGAVSSPARMEDPVSSEEGRYTSLQGPHCRTEVLGDEIQSTRTTCAGVAPYNLVVTDSDARQSIDVIAGDGAPQPLMFGMTVSGAFSELGDTVEWRPASEATPTALITRFNAYQHPDRVTSYLVVAKLLTKQGSCVTEVIAPGAKQNVLAREAADRAATAPCREPPDFS